MTLQEFFFPTKKKLIAFALFIIIDILVLFAGVMGLLFALSDAQGNLMFLVPLLGFFAAGISALLNLIFLIILIPLLNLFTGNLSINNLILVLIPFLINAWIYSCAIVFVLNHFNKNKPNKKRKASPKKQKKK